MKLPPPLLPTPAATALTLAAAVLLAGAALFAACDSEGGTSEEACEHDLALSVDWTGSEWAITEAEGRGGTACRGHRVTWSLGTTPNNATEYFAWIHIEPAAFEASAALDPQTGFAVVSTGVPLELTVREAAPLGPLHYGVLCLNLVALESDAQQLRELNDGVDRRDFEAMRRFQRLTFAQQDSPPQMIIR